MEVIAKERNEIDKLISELQTLDDKCEDAIDSLRIARVALSELV